MLVHSDRSHRIQQILERVIVGALFVYVVCSVIAISAMQTAASSTALLTNAGLIWTILRGLSKMLRFSFINSSKIWGGEERFVMDLAASLQDLGHNVIVYGRPGGYFLQRVAAAVMARRRNFYWPDPARFQAITTVSLWSTAGEILLASWCSLSRVYMGISLAFS